MNPSVAGQLDRVGPYQLVKAIGAGGSARIDLARIERAYGFQRHVVIKRPLEHLRGDPKAAAGLLREATIGARLRHPNLVGILDVGVHDGYDYLVLEYIHGGSLRTLMQADAPARVHDCPTNTAIAIVGEIARGLHAAHELADDAGHPLGLVHRDVSPGNILVGLDGAVKLADFGIAKETRVQTLSGSMHGTVTYMAPEQCRGHAFDRRADVWALGVILYELATSTRLFWADNDVASLHRVLSGTVPRPRKVRPSIAPALEDIIMTAVATDPNRRFASARDLADALEIYASAAGEILGARWIARWVHDILGPREAPWIGAPTVIDVPVALPRDDDAALEGSLVELIESIQLPEEPPPDPTFGPTAPSFSDEIDTEPRRAPARRRRKRLAAVVALGLAGGAGGTAFVMTRGGSSPPGTSSPAVGSSNAPSSTTPPTAPLNPPAAGESDPEMPATDTQDDAIELTPEPVRPASRKRRDRSKPRDAAPPNGSAAAVVEAPKPPEGSAGSAGGAAGAGSGSAKRGTNPKVEWNPTMLLPTDSGSGTKKQ